MCWLVQLSSTYALARLMWAMLLHQTCTKKHVPITLTMHQPCIKLYLNIYHQKLHQPCTKYIPIMHQIHINYDSSRCTNIINYTPHVCANSSTTCLNHVPNMYLKHISKYIHQYNHQNLSNNSSLYR
jgi:hypothetical protein